MALSEDMILGILRLISDTDVTELHVETPDFKLVVMRGPVREHPTGSGANGAAPPGAAPPQPQQPPAPAAPPSAVPAGLVPVTAPLAGVFYRSPNPGAPPYIREGDQVGPDTVVGLLEVMKLLSPVVAGAHGTVERVLVADGETVSEGQPLLWLRPLPATVAR